MEIKIDNKFCCGSEVNFTWIHQHFSFLVQDVLMNTAGENPGQPEEELQTDQSNLKV